MSAAAPQSPLQVLILMFDDMELLDFAGPYEVFTTAARVQRRQAGRDDDSPPLWTVHTASPDGAPVVARAGLKLQADHRWSEAPQADVLLVPGGVVDGVLANPLGLAQIRQQALRTPLVASICTGAFILAEAGVLREGPCTTHWEDADDLRRRYPLLQVQPQARWVDQGPLITSAGISAGLDMSLHVVERLAGRPLAKATARQMDYAWRDV